MQCLLTQGENTSQKTIANYLGMPLQNSLLQQYFALKVFCRLLKYTIIKTTVSVFLSGV